MQPHTHCSYCGTKHETEKWPRTCGTCNQTTWKNPLPVVVALIPIGEGVLTVRRNIHPGFGRLALPGGFMETGETWQEAVARETFEETALRFRPEDFKLHELVSAADKEHLLIFAQAKKNFGYGNYAQAFKPNTEVSELVVVSKAIELAFPTHTQMLALFLPRAPYSWDL